MPDNLVQLKRKRFPGLLIWLIIFILLLGGILFFVVGQSRIKQVIVSGSVHYGEDEIASMMGVNRETTVLDVLMGRLEMTRGLPYIKDVTVDYLSFNSIHIMVTEKEVISYIPYQGQYLALDKDGYIVGYEDEKVVKRASVSGLYFDSASLGQKLEVSEPVLMALLEFYHLGTKYQVPIEELIFIKGDASMIHGMAGAVTIVFGDAQSLDRKMKDAGEVLEKLDLSVAGTLDLQADMESYIFKEAIGARYYMPYGERYLAVAADGTIKKISVHRMVTDPLITGIDATDPHVGEVILADEAAIGLINKLLDIGEDQSIPISSVDYTHTNVLVTCGKVRMQLGKPEEADYKLGLGMEVYHSLDRGSVGEIDLRETLESYEFQPDAETGEE